MRLRSTHARKQAAGQARQQRHVPCHGSKTTAAVEW
jgi:hypothetical protein